MTVEATAQEATNEAALDVSSLPATAFPEGVDPATYIASLGQKKEGETANSDAPVRPDHIPEKFWNAEKGTVDTDGLAKSYAELEKRFSAEKPKSEDDTSLTIGKTDDEANAEIAAPLTAAFQAFASAYDTNGEVSDTEIAAIVKLGVPENIVANYVAGLEALGREGQRNAADAAGGQEKLSEALTWGKANLSKADAEVYDNIIKSGHIAQGVQWLMDRYNNANPSEGTFVQTTAGAGAHDVFRSKAEMIAQMNDPRYPRDAAFRQDVADKVARSKSAGTLN